MKKQVLAAGCAVLLAGALALPALAQNLAVVNGKPVPQSRLDELEAQLQAQATRSGQQMPPGIKDQLKKQVIDSEIFMQEAKRLGLDDTPGARSKMELMRQNVVIGELFEDYEKKHPVTDEEAKAEYDNIVAAQTKASAGAKEYAVHHILVEKEVDAKSIIAQIKKGAKFEDLAKKYSKDPGSGAKGGDLGWANPAGYVPEFAEAVKKLGKGEMTQEPVKSQFGYHIIRMDDVRDAKPPEMPKFDDVKAQLKQQLQRKKLTQYAEDLRAKAKVE
ncbi:MAG: peptidylprolyl isomerase [Burkholderiaceae bacterium]|jgi:peptidyl-prolyl cis-trans isomerase C|nr:peptidylprolyl isomerase [Burkholderiaceae bacterium]